MPGPTVTGSPEALEGRGDASRFWVRSRRLLVGLVVCRGLVFLCVMPPFEGWDEYQHVGYIEHMRSTGQAAIYGVTNVPTPLLEAAVKLPHPSRVAGPLGGVDYARFWERHDPRDPSRGPPEFKGGTLALYQAQHSPLYYRLAAPLFAALGGVTDLKRSVGGLRLTNVALTAGALWVALGALRRATRDERDAVLIGLAIAAHPLFLLNGARVANDALGVALGTASVASCLGLVLDREPRRPVVRWFVTGLLIGLAILAKATNFSLVPFAAFCWVAALARTWKRKGRAAWAGLALAAGCLAVIQSDLRFNLMRYGVITPMQEAVFNRAIGRTRADLFQTASTIDWVNTTKRLWESGVFYVGGWSALWTRDTAVRAYGNALKVGLLGWVWCMVVGRRRRAVFTSAWVPTVCVVLVASYTGALGYHMVQSKLAWGTSSTGPWYACPALPWFLTLAVAGGLCWPLGKWLRPSVPVALAGAGITAEVIGVFGLMVHTYSGGARGWESLSRLAAVQDPLLGTFTLALALAAEVVVLAALVLVWHDAVRDDCQVVLPPLRGPLFLRRRPTRRSERLDV